MAFISSLQAATKSQMQTLIPKSTFISMLEYDQTNLTMTSWMSNGSVYQHKFIMPLDWDALKTAQNHGKHWSKNIRGKKLSVKVKSAKAPKAEMRRK